MYLILLSLVVEDLLQFPLILRRELMDCALACFHSFRWRG
jgi:hypothetical protein